MSTDPLAEDVAILVNVRAEFSQISTSYFPTETGEDGLLYYRLEYEIEVTYCSAYTKYELIYQRKNYGPVHAEYV